MTTSEDDVLDLMAPHDLHSINLLRNDDLSFVVSKKAKAW